MVPLDGGQGNIRLGKAYTARGSMFANTQMIGGEGFDLAKWAVGDGAATEPETPLPFPSLFGGLASATSAAVGSISGAADTAWAEGWAD